MHNKDIYFGNSSELDFFHSGNEMRTKEKRKNLMHCACDCRRLGKCQLNLIYDHSQRDSLNECHYWERLPFREEYIDTWRWRGRNYFHEEFAFALSDNWSRLMDSWIVGCNWCQTLESDVVDWCQPLEIDVNPWVCLVAHSGSPSSMVKGLKFVWGIKAWRSVYMQGRLFYMDSVITPRNPLWL